MTGQNHTLHWRFHGPQSTYVGAGAESDSVSLSDSRALQVIVSVTFLGLSLCALVGVLVARLLTD